MLLMRRTQQQPQPQPGNELTELLWDNGPALRRPQLPAAPFPPFACSAAGASRAQELAKHHHPAMRDLLAAPDDDDAVPWLQHYPDIGVDDDDGDRDTAPLPPEYCSALLSGYSSHPAAVDSRNDAGGSTSHGAAVGPPTVPPKQHQARPSGEGIMNFTFFSKPLQRPQPPPSAAPSIPVGVGVESTVVQTNRLRSTPLFSEQRMAWLQPPPKESCPTVAASPPPPPAAPPVPLWQREFAAAVAALPQRRQSETRAPDRPPPLPPATATTSSVCSDNGDRSQLKRSSGSQQAPEWSVSQEDEDLEVDDEAGGARRSAARSTKRGRTAEVHNMSERRRRDRINEKMRALQELIPNCNKIDKASMLEEAIEYLKTLQLQVQMMSTMGCVPPMLAMQHMQMPPMAAHFHHHHLGAMGFGMGAFDPRLVAAAAAAAAGAAQFPYPMIPGMPMFGHGHAMPSPPPFPHQAAAAAMGAHVSAGIVVDNDGTAAAHAEQQTPGDHAPHVPRTM